MKHNSRESILQSTIKILAMNGAKGLSMRQLAKQSGIAASVLYHYFEDKDQLLRAAFDQANTDLGQARSELSPCSTAADLLRQRILFQLDHIEEVVAVLKYYLAYRHHYTKNPAGVLPDKAYLHMTEVLDMAERTQEFVVADKVAAAQVMTHAVNGFLLEYYPEPLSVADKTMIADKLYVFLHSALKGGEL